MRAKKGQIMSPLSSAATCPGPYTHLVNPCIALLGDKVAWTGHDRFLHSYAPEERKEISQG